MASEVLTEVAKVILDGEAYLLGKNGRFALVKSGGRDAFGKEYHVTVDLMEFIGITSGQYAAEHGEQRAKVQALVDALGEAWVELNAARESLVQARGLRQGNKE